MVLWPQFFVPMTSSTNKSKAVSDVPFGNLFIRAERVQKLPNLVSSILKGIGLVFELFKPRGKLFQINGGFT